MLEFNVPKMSCGSCARAITDAVRSVYPAAVVEVDLSTRRVSVRSELGPERIEAAIEEAGYAAERQAA